MNKQQIKSLLDKGELWNYIIIDELNKKHVGDVESKEIVFLSTIGRLVINKKPFSFNILIHSESSAGKDHLVESVLQLFPKEDIEAFGRISKTCLTYIHNAKDEPLWTYDGKVLYLEEITEEVLNNEVMKVFTAGLSRSAITKDQKAEVVEVKGKPVVICTTATTKPTPEILNRFSIVKLDESEEQTERTYMAEEEDYDEDIIKFLGELKPYKIIISKEMKRKIGKIFPKGKVRYRREFPRFLDIIRAVTIFNQGKKPISNGEIISDWDDYDSAVSIFRSYRSGVSSIPLKREDKKIIEVLEKSEEPLSAREILSEMEGYLSQMSIYKHLSNLTNHEILDSFDLRDNFNNPVIKYKISTEFADKNPIQLPLYLELI